MRAIGLMSGTSLDGVDVALIETDGEAAIRLGPSGFRPYAPEERDLLRLALADAAFVTDRDERPGLLGAAEDLVTRAHAEAVEAFRSQNGIGDADIVGFHGQTVLHRPELSLTVQIGDARSLARRLGLPVVHDFRSADVAAGGQGAPLVPVYHQALVAAESLPVPVAVLNVGGVANVTWLDGRGDPIACDTGPGNALLDDFMLERTGIAVDRDGAAAASGRIDQGLLRVLLSHPFFQRKLPKSLDRNDFSPDAVESLTTADGAATLTAFTAHAAARIVDHLPSAPRAWIVCGGGARNPTLLAMLRDATGTDVVSADSLGWSADAMEAQAFAYLAVRYLRGLPFTFPTTTGVPHPVGGGRLAVPDEPTEC